MVLMGHRAIGEWVPYPNLSLRGRPPSHSPSNGEAGINLEIELEVGIRNSCKKGTTKKSIWGKQVLKEIKRFFNILKNSLLANR